jgi:intracellular sulfur oxidation DsrE/DsrF family protein
MSTRREFVTGSSLFALAPAMGRGTQGTFTFDRAAFNATLGKRARHKQCFGATRISNGTLLEEMLNSISAYAVDLNEGPGSLHAVGVLYHGASIFMAMNDDLWNKIVIPGLPGLSEEIRADIGAVTPGKGNPYLHAAPSDTADASVEQLVRMGSSFFVCNNALMGFAQLFAGALKERSDSIQAEMLAAVVPGALVVPAGVMAINACQEAKFTYLQASL